MQHARPDSAFNPQQPATASTHSSRLSAVRKIMFATGAGVTSASFQMVSMLLLIFYNQVLGMSPGLASLALAISVMVDALWDPLLGHFSDGLRTRLGRRHPLMYGSIVPIAASFVLLWNPPPGLSEVQLFVWLLCFVGVFRFSASLFEVPFIALVPELAPGYHERTRLFTLKQCAGLLSNAMVAMLIYGVFLQPSADHTVGQLNSDAYGPLSLAIAAFMVTVILVSSIASQGAASSLRQPRHEARTLSRSIAEFVEALRSWNFGVALVSGLFSAISASLFYGLAIYINTYVWALPATAIMLLMFHTLLAAPLAWFAAPWLSRTIGKRNACVLMLCAYGVLGNLALLLRLFGWFPDNGSTFLLPTLWILTALSGTSIACGRIIQSSMVADIVEEREAVTGRRAEGLILAAESFLEKFMQGLATILPGVVLILVGFPASAQPDTLDSAIIQNLLMIVLPLKIGVSLLAALVWMLFRLDRNAHDEALAKIAQRGAVSN